MTSIKAASRRRAASSDGDLNDEDHDITSRLLIADTDDSAEASSGGGGGEGLAARTGTVHGRRFWLAWVGFFVLGTVNNLPYVIVASAADAIVKR
jgi:hypothetical protein